jgi:hypothetical protein
MSNAKRPTLERKVTRASESKRKDELNLGLSISVDGTVYTVRQGDLTSLDTMALRRETGYSFMGLLKAFQADPDIDLIAALVWLARRIDGEQMLAYADVASEIGYDVDIDVVGEAGEESDPEA